MLARPDFCPAAGSRAMNFQQLRIIRETVRQNFNLTEVANALYARNPASASTSRTWRTNWPELFIRKGKRFLWPDRPRQGVCW